jgi:hypothetical protein
LALIKIFLTNKEFKHVPRECKFEIGNVNDKKKSDLKI